MLLNYFFPYIQSKMNNLYQSSFLIQKLDWFIGVNLLLVILSSPFASTDSIGYFAIFATILTLIKIFIKKGEKFELTLADKFLLVYFIFTIISLAGSSLLLLSLKGFLKTVIYIGFYISLTHYLKDNKHHAKYFFLAFIFCLSLESIVAFLQNYTSVAEISGWQDTSKLNPEQVMTRVYGTLKPYNPNLFGGYLLSILPSFLLLPFLSKKGLCWTIIIGISSTIAILLTGCRGAYIGLFFEIIILAGIVFKLLKPSFRKLFTTVVGIFVTISSFVVISLPALRARIFSIFAMRQDSSNSFRFNVYNSSIEMFKDNWLLGIGCGNQNFREIYGLYMKTGFDALSTYNIYLEIAVESGIFALIFFLLFLLTNFKKAYHFIFDSRTINIEKVFVIVAITSLIGILIHGVVDTVFFRPQIQFAFWTMVAIIREFTKN